MDPVAFTNFRGLALRDDPEDVGAERAIAGLNFDLDRPQRVRSRDGSTRLGASTTTGATPLRVIPMSYAGTEVLLTLSYSAVNTIYLDKFSTTGTRTAVGSWVGNYISDHVRFGTPTAEYVYVTSVGSAAWPSSPGVIERYDGTTLATGTGSPVYLALLPAENRLVQGHFTTAAGSPSGANGSRSTVFFSDAGAPDTFTATNYVHLQPGDGDYIVGMETWRTECFVFKNRTMFVFGPSTTKQDGSSQFLCRTVSLPTGIEPPSSTKSPIVAGTDGIYFFAGHQIFKTTGGEPVVVSDAIEPILRRTTSSTLNYGGNEISLSWANERLYVRYLPESGSEPQVLVYDTRIGEWMLWQFGDSSNTTARIFSNVAAWQARPYYLRSNGGIMYVAPSTTTDDGVAIASSWQSGHYDLGGRARVRETVLWGTGTPTLSVFTDETSTDASAAAVTLGTSPQVADGVQRVARRGAMFSHKFSVSSGAWSVSKVIQNVADRRLPGMRPS